MKESAKETVLVTEWYCPANDTRRIELQRALLENLSCCSFAKVILFAETRDGIPDEAKRNPKLVIINSETRPSFQEIFAYANRQLRETQVVVANNDISFRNSGALDVDTGTFAVFSRHELIGSEITWSPDACADSQDAWLFQTPCRVKGATFFMGRIGCDNRLAWLARMSGYHVRNDGRSTVTIHYHESQHRGPERANHVPSPYLTISEEGEAIEFLHPRSPASDLLRSLTCNFHSAVFTIRFIIARVVRMLAARRYS
ncbi:hypothetical protein Enr13x_30910 [Stieleria neptunia]|uniref:Uncharacterized protein n=1 Tax=Stieleria neptunia TaxID=2527979 RepID=A0A518HQV0_9BACT|nr:hypothetical protein Enr13x_30910 [Stieleria neptunia]